VVSRHIDQVRRSVEEFVAARLIVRSSERYEGRWLELDGRMLLNFGSCSYLALERRPELRAGTTSAVERYGTQFPFSRAYLSCGLYRELEVLLEEITGRPVVVTQSTTFAHLAALPVLVGENDAVLVDQFAHASIQAALSSLPAVPVRTVRHGHIDQVEPLLASLSSAHDRVWLLIDGLYSMLGDCAPYGELEELLARFPKLHLYIDDAHATSWTGTHGRGQALMHLGHHQRVAVVLSLNKAFSAAGGVLALPSRGLARLLRYVAAPLMFSGPIPPPMLGAAVASAELHLSDELPALQAELAARIDHTLARAEALAVPLATRHRTPIFFVPCHSSGHLIATVRKLWLAGFYVCPSAFPAVPVNQPGIRFTITLHNQRDDIDAFLAALKMALSLA
jgi:7-keto-8-aminopelargonate synthetase-like enzyme